MITIEFSPVERLPNIDIAEKGPVSARFLDRELTNLIDVARYLRDMPYGINASSADSMIVFEDGFGTCNTKHGIFVRLCEEYDLDIVRYEGFYPLTDKIITGTDAILADYGLPFIPRAHCFLVTNGRYFDLTEGNCNGKNCMIFDYFDIFPVPADQCKDTYKAMYVDYFHKTLAQDSRFAALGFEKMWECHERCSANGALLCPSPFATA